MGVQTVEVSAAFPRNDVEKGNLDWGKNMQRWRNDNVDISKGSSQNVTDIYSRYVRRQRVVCVYEQ